MYGRAKSSADGRGWFGGFGDGAAGRASSGDADGEGSEAVDEPEGLEVLQMGDGVRVASAKMLLG